MSERPLLAVSLVYDWYQDFIPAYLSSLLLSYPNYHAAIYLEETLTEGNRDAIGYIRSQISGHFRVYENTEMPWEGQARKAERWVLGEDVFRGFRYGWISDIDILVVRESPALHAMEAARAEAIGYPYANVVRANSPDRMSGTMFIEVEPYYDAMRDIIVEARRCPAEFIPAEEQQVQGYNERLLKLMVRRGIGLLEVDEPRPYDTAEMHGVHLGVLRGIDRRLSAWRNDPLRRQIRRIIDDKRFRMVQAMCGWRVARCLDRLRGYLDFDRAKWSKHPDYIRESK